MKMITKFKIFENKDKEKSLEIKSELSKHLPLLSKEDNNLNLDIFLIDDDYGIFVGGPIKEWSNVPLCYVNGVFKRNDKWQIKPGSKRCNYHNIEIDDFVEDVVKDYKKRNISRLEKRKKRELAKMSKKFNI